MTQPDALPRTLNSDVLRVIFQELIRPQSAPSTAITDPWLEGSRRSLANAALCSRAVSTIALGVLWSTMISVIPLFKVVEGVIWVDGIFVGYYSLSFCY